MKKIYLLILTAASLASGMEATAQVTYQNAFDFGNDDYINQALPGAGGTHFYVGSTNSTGAGGYDALFTQTDSSGNVLWEKQYGGSRTEYGTRFIHASDGSFVITGRSNSYSASGQHDAYIAKVDGSGTLLWSTTYGTDSLDYAFDIIEAPDSGYVIAGLTYGQGAPKLTGRSSVFVVKTDRNGNLQWSKAMGDTVGNEGAYTLAPAGPNGFLIGGYSGAGLIGMNDNLLIYCDWSGNILVSLVTGGTGDDEVRNIIAPTMNTNFLLLAGNTYSWSQNGSLYVQKINVGGGVPSLAWTKTYGGNGEYITDFINVNPNEYLLLGNSPVLNGGNNASFLTMIDSNGVSQWTQYYPAISTTYNNLSDINLLPSGQLLLAGYTAADGGTADDFYLVQANADGSACGSMTATISDSLRTATQASVAPGTFFSDSLGINTASVSMSTNSNTATPHQVCISTGINEINADNSINVYPNPASSAISVTATSAIREIRISDNMGRAVYVSVNMNATEKNINVLPFAAGLYTVSVKSDNETRNLRLVITK